jgi:hypothetical protein
MACLFAYLDAGTGSMILQALMGGFAGFMVLSRIAWQNLLPRLGIRCKEETLAD